MSLSRRGFLTSLLATSALAPIAPATFQPLLEDALADTWAKIVDFIIEKHLQNVDPVVDDLWLFGRAFFRDGEHIPAVEVFEGIEEPL